MPICPLHAATGLDCPLCGATRASIALFEGDLPAAFGYNVVFVAALPVIVAVLVLARMRLVTTSQVVDSLNVAVLGWTAGVWFVVRNLPWSPFTALGA
jgi:hypothetical protein